ncbi:DUF58 domain-containing protein [Sulfurimonas aquatica]|uniref:DUF58 domain-containing protein n=1 Tax=Sulfurimonas aquatica TaxID=2672570 RepID=A0A975AYT0_9BACT|nr:DUF58 domain-containing protein [Sulfurimonas aquatica]QSZ41066.1 DUF58 domain-containing protein [Sulfurimonas aquatica]
MKSLKTYISIFRSVNNKPTKYFLFLVVAIVGLFLQAYMHNYNIVFLVLFFLVGIAGASSMYGVYNIYHIKGRLLSYDRFFAGSASTYKLSIVNEYEYPSYDITLTSKQKEIHIESIKPHHFQTISLEEKFDTRGKHSLSNIKMHSFFPLPHEIKFKEIEINKEVIVYAKPEGISLFKFYNKNNSMSGEIDEFDGVKKFNQGDSTSYIHWASLAKNDTLMVKNFLYEDETKKLYFDFKTMTGTNEERLSQLTLWVLECEKNRFDFTINLNGDILESKKMSTDEILQAIAQF